MGSRATFGVRGFGPLLLLLVGLASISSVAGLKCFHCAEPDCSTKFGEEVPCDDGGMCSKILTEVDDKKTILRACIPAIFVEEKGIKVGCDKAEGESGGKKAKLEACNCKTDLCNGHFKHHPSSIMVLVTAIATILFYARDALGIASPY